MCNKCKNSVSLQISGKCLKTCHQQPYFRRLLLQFSSPSPPMCKHALGHHHPAKQILPFFPILQTSYLYSSEPAGQVYKILFVRIIR